MPKTLLDITQEILTQMTSDEVNSINDTGESEVVARIIISTFEDMVSNRNWPSHKQLIVFESFTDDTKPTHMALPTNVKELLTVNYNKRRVGDARLRYEPVTWREPDQFLIATNSYNSTESTVQTVTDPTGIKLLIKNNRHPTFYTSFDDNSIVMDSFDGDVDSVLHPEQVQAMGYVQPVALFSDAWIPDLPEEAIRALVSESLSTAQFRINSMQDIKAEQESTRQQRWLARKAWRVRGGIRFPNYGRRSIMGHASASSLYRDSTFRRDD